MGRVGGDRAHISDKHTKAQRPEREDGWEGRGQAEGHILSAQLLWFDCIFQPCFHIIKISGMKKHEQSVANARYVFSHFELGHSSQFILI